MHVHVRACLLVLLLAASLPAVTIGQVDDFQDGTTMGWFVPDPTNPNPPANEPNGGPSGAGDAYLRLIATGNVGPGGRLAVLNESQWAGDYLGAGVRFIDMDVNNFGPDDLDLRLLFEDFAGMGPPANLALSANAVHVPAGSGWTRVRFPVSPADLVVETFGTVTGALMNTDTLRIFHNPDPTFPGPGVGIPRVNVTLGVDNITAAVPEPGTITLLIGGALIFLARSRRRWMR
jgi:hypothetical protein